VFAWILNIGRALPYDERPQIKTNYILTIDMPTSNEDKKSPSLLSRAIEKITRNQKTMLPTAVNNKAKTALPTVKLIRNFPSTKEAKTKHKVGKTASPAIAVRPVPARCPGTTSGHDHRQSTIGIEQRCHRLKVKVFSRR